jgi:hypothetical protein
MKKINNTKGGCTFVSLPFIDAKNKTEQHTGRSIAKDEDVEVIENLYDYIV